MTKPNPIFKDYKKPLLVIIGAFLSGILGRMGGVGKPYNTKYRDLGVAFIFTSLMVWFTIESFNLWLLVVHIVAFLGLFGSLTTYWDEIFKEDNFWTAGFVVGLSAFPYSIISHRWLGFGIRSILLALIWGCLNKYLPSKVLIWRRDIAEEFLRYCSIVITIPLLLM